MMYTQAYRQGWINSRQESHWPRPEIRAQVGAHTFRTNSVKAAKRWIRKVEAMPVADFFKMQRSTRAKNYKEGCA